MYFPNCLNAQCPFLHPGPNASIPRSVPPSEVVCRFDGVCTREGCFFKHVKGKKTHVSDRKFIVEDSSNVNGDMEEDVLVDADKKDETTVEQGNEEEKKDAVEEDEYFEHEMIDDSNV